MLSDFYFFEEFLCSKEFCECITFYLCVCVLPTWIFRHPHHDMEKKISSNIYRVFQHFPLCEGGKVEKLHFHLLEFSEIIS